MESGSINANGYMYDYLEKIAEHANWSYEYVPCNWTDGLIKLKSGQIDIFGPVPKTEQLEKEFDFHDFTIGYEFVALFAPKEKNVYYDNINSFDGIKVGTSHTSSFNKILTNYCEKNNININFVYTDADNKRIVEEMREGRYDVYLCGSMYEIPETKIISQITSEPMYFAVRRGASNIVHTLNKAMSEMTKDNPYFQSQLHKKYYGDKIVNKPFFTMKEMEIIGNYSKIKIGYESEVVPMQYTDKKTKKPTGVAIEILKEISYLTGIEFEFISLEKGHESQIDKLDMTLCRHETDIGKTTLLSEPYHTIPTLFVGHQVENLGSNLKVAILDFNSAHTQSIKNQYPSFEIIECEGIDEIINSLDDHSIDTALISVYMYDEISRRVGDKRYVTYPTSLSFPMSIGISNQLPSEFISIINKAISLIPKQTIDGIAFTNAVGRPREKSIVHFLQDNAINIISVASVIVGCMLMLIIHTFKMSKQIKHMAFVDEITGLSSYQKFKMDVEESLENAKPNEFMITVLDIDKFKYVNDILGFKNGNMVLKLLAQHINLQTPDDVLFTRHNIDHFVIFYRSVDKSVWFQGPDERKILDEKMKPVLGDSIRLTFSLGTYKISDPTESLSSMIDCANIAKKSVKDIYGDSYAEFTWKMKRKIDEQRNIVLSMEQALLNHEFVPFLQPKYALSTGEIVGAEILVRWFSPDKGVIQPDNFIPLFEKNGFIRKLDLYMFEKACCLLRYWMDNRICNIPVISVNLSKATIDVPNLSSKLISLAQKYAISSQSLEIELTESVLMDNHDLTMETMSGLKKDGFSISIDDFGSGFSSLSLLKNLPADILKLDKEFLNETIGNSNGREIIGSVIAMSKRLNLKTVAEGVETFEQAESLREMGCDIAQGYYFSRPISVKDFEVILQKEIKG